MPVTVAEIYNRAARKKGGRTGTIASGNATTAALTGLIGTTGDNSFYAGDRLFFLDAGTSTDRERLIIGWSDSTGVATFLTRIDITPTNESYIVEAREDYTLAEYDSAFVKALRDTKRTYRYVIPATPVLRYQVLNALDWLQGDGQVDAVFRSDSPLMLHNEDFSLWQNGASSTPDSYTLTGSGATVVRVSGGIRSLYAARITAGAAAATMYQDIPESLTQWLTRRTFPVFTPMRAGVWLKTSQATAARIFIYDGTTTTYSNYASGSGYPEFLSLSLTPDATMSTFRWGVELAGTKTADVSWAGLMQNTVTMDDAYQIRDAGSQFYSEYQANDVVRNIGGQPMIEFQNYPATWGQIIVYSRRPYPAIDPAVDGYTSTVDSQYAEILEAGLLKWMLESIKPNQDRTRLDGILANSTSIWNRRATNTLDLPVPRPPAQMRVVGA